MSCKCIPGMTDKKADSSIMNIISQIPTHPSYTIEQSTPDDNNHFSFTLLNQNTVQYPWIDVLPYNIQSLGKRIPLLYLKNKNASSDSITILYCHGIRTDLGRSYGFLLDLVTMLKCNIISYDYTLNISNIKKNTQQLEESLVDSIEPVLEYITRQLLISTKHLVLMSHSFGSIPITYITASEDCRKILGLILVAPLTTPNTKKKENVIEDSNPVVQSFYNISCNVFIIHGQNDDVVSYLTSKKLCSYIKNCESFFPVDAGHDDIFIGAQREIVYEKLKQFMEMLPVTNTNKRQPKRITTSSSSSFGDLNSTKTSGDSNVDNNNNNTNNCNLNINTISNQLCIAKGKDDYTNSNSNSSSNNKFQVGSMYPSLENNFLM